MGIAVRFLVFVMLIYIGEARQCYNCTGDCVRFTDCKGSCYTSVPELGGDEIRSCTVDTEETRCIPDSKEGILYKTCFCNTERCNPASPPVQPDILLFLLISVPLFLRVR